ncbi:hypothetical protein Vretimale_19106 [Volvox reticuliferus]|uniref:Uncharacterized protein n=1 Tax=Volvox reticuliferus TaxID=1737510 RepID=A0A8J4H022_9CHLO|nr:hypothetical protein Vretifemale_20548 [Volvox reticuliferus]GIM16473.1 hypothetical protein Vretimale_19106 [Volvox reticuliferus]
MQHLQVIAKSSSRTNSWLSVLQLKESVKRGCFYSCARQDFAQIMYCYHAPAFPSSPTLCGKGDNRTRRGKIFRNMFREHLPRQFLYPEQFPGGPAFHRAGTHGWREERFRYPCDTSLPTAPSAPGPSGPQ